MNQRQQVENYLLIALEAITKAQAIAVKTWPGDSFLWTLESLKMTLAARLETWRNSPPETQVRRRD